MDTHITTAPDIDERIGGPIGSPIRLPGARGTLPHLADDDLELSSVPADAPEAVKAGASQADETVLASARRTRRRFRLLSTAAVVVVLAGVGGVAWAERHGALNLPLPPQLVSLLRTPLPSTTQVAGEVGVTPPRRQPAMRLAGDQDPVQSARAARQQTEFASLKSGDIVPEVGAAASNYPPANPTPTKPTSPTLTDPASVVTSSSPVPPAPLAMVDIGPQTAQASSTPAPAVVSSTAATPAVTSPAALAPAPLAAPAAAPLAAPKPRDPVQTAVDLRAEPLSLKQQVEVVGLVRELGAQLKESRLTVAQMQATVAEIKEQLDSRMTEFDGRLGLAEAGTVLAQSARAALPQPAPLPAVTPLRQLATMQRQLPAAASASEAPTRRTIKDFRVQGASPGLVVLNVLGATPGEAPVLYLALGDQVPGIGRIKSIYQRGTTWLVQTDAGLIQ